MAWTVEDCAHRAAGARRLRSGGRRQRRQRRSRITARALTGDIRGLRIGVLRHYWEEDLPAHEDLRRAMDEAIDVFRKLGANVEDCRARPMMDSLDVKVIIAESEIFSIHHHDLVSAPRRFRPRFPRPHPARVPVPGRGLRRRPRASTAASSRRRAPLYEKYDVLLTAGFGPAPRLDAHRTLNFWQTLERVHAVERHRRPGAGAAATASAEPACRSACRSSAGRSTRRPCCSAGHAYEQATDWRARRPQLMPGTPQPAVTPKGNEPDASASTPQRAALALDIGGARRAQAERAPAGDPARDARRTRWRWRTACARTAAGSRSRRWCSAFPNQ